MALHRRASPLAFLIIFMLLHSFAVLQRCFSLGLGYEVTDLREHANKQGFEATLKLVQHSGNNTYGADINPLRLLVKYVTIYLPCSALMLMLVELRVWVYIYVYHDLDVEQNCFLDFFLLWSRNKSKCSFAKLNKNRIFDVSEGAGLFLGLILWLLLISESHFPGCMWMNASKRVYKPALSEDAAAACRSSFKLSHGKSSTQLL